MVPSGLLILVVTLLSLGGIDGFIDSAPVLVLLPHSKSPYYPLQLRSVGQIPRNELQTFDPKKVLHVPVFEAYQTSDQHIVMIPKRPTGSYQTNQVQAQYHGRRNVNYNHYNHYQHQMRPPPTPYRTPMRAQPIPRYRQQPVYNVQQNYGPKPLPPYMNRPYPIIGAPPPTTMPPPLPYPTMAPPPPPSITLPPRPGDDDDDDEETTEKQPVVDYSKFEKANVEIRPEDANVLPEKANENQIILLVPQKNTDANTIYVPTAVTIPQHPLPSTTEPAVEPEKTNEAENIMTSIMDSLFDGDEIISEEDLEDRKRDLTHQEKLLQESEQMLLQKVLSRISMKELTELVAENVVKVLKSPEFTSKSSSGKFIPTSTQSPMEEGSQSTLFPPFIPLIESEEEEEEEGGLVVNQQHQGSLVVNQQHQGSLFRPGSPAENRGT